MKQLVWLALLGALSAAAPACEWIKTQRAPSGTLVRVTFALPYSNNTESERLFQEVSNPSSPLFRKFLSPEKVKELSAPSEESRKAVEVFLQARFPSTEMKWSAWGHFLHLQLPVADVEKLLSTECFVYVSNCRANHTIIKTSNDTFPNFALSPILAYIGGVTQFPVPSHRPRWVHKVLEFNLSEVNASADALEQPIWSSGKFGQPIWAAGSGKGLQPLEEPIWSTGGQGDEDWSAAYDYEGPSYPRRHHTRMELSDWEQPIWPKRKENELSPTKIAREWYSWPWAPPPPQHGGEDGGDGSSEGNSYAMDDDDTVENPVEFNVGDKSALFKVNLVCPDGKALTKVGSSAPACADGSSLSSIVIRWAMASDPQQSREYELSDMGRACYYSPEVYCYFLIPLAANYVRYAFGFDFMYSGNLNYTYNLQEFILGTEDMTVPFVKRFYNVPDGMVVRNSSSYQAIGALTLRKQVNNNGYYSRSDLKSFYSATNIPATNMDRVDFRGTGVTNDETLPDVETTLDIQWITGMAVGARSSVWHAAATDAESFESIIAQVQDAASRGDAPSVLSFSYGGPERMFKSQASVLTQHESGFRSLGLLGITVLAASGDTGPYWGGYGCDSFEPGYPASSQYVTSVGATQLIAQNVHNVCTVTESACSLRTGSQITSGGGFSNYLSRPDWQEAAVQEYLSANQLPSKDFNREGRAYPDISLFGRSFEIVYKMQEQQVDGTSASSPALGGMITLINDLRLSQGQGPLGFLNPFLYKMQRERPEALNDIVFGGNGCTKGLCCDEGFIARPGWDPVTGLGTPVFDEFAAYFGVTVTGRVTPLIFPEDLDCTQPMIQPNKVNTWKTTQWIVIAVAISVTVVGLAVILFCWRMKMQRGRSQVHVQNLQHGLVGGE